MIKSWIPAVVLLVLIVAALVIALTARSTNVGAAPTKAPTDAVTAEGTSLFTPAGLAYIADTRKVFLNATKLPIAAAPLGLGDATKLTIAPPTEGVYEYLSVVSADGGLRFMGTSVTIATAQGRVTSATVRDDTRFLPYRDALALLRDRADRYGIPATEVDGFASAAAAAAKKGDPYRYRVHTDDALGVGLTVTADCSSDSICAIVDRVEFG